MYISQVINDTPFRARSRLCTKTMMFRSLRIALPLLIRVRMYPRGLRRLPRDGDRGNIFTFAFFRPNQHKSRRPVRHLLFLFAVHCPQFVIKVGKIRVYSRSYILAVEKEIIQPSIIAPKRPISHGGRAIV